MRNRSALRLLGRLLLLTLFESQETFVKFLIAEQNLERLIGQRQYYRTIPVDLSGTAKDR